jgi:DNA repair protein RadC
LDDERRCLLLTGHQGSESEAALPVRSIIADAVRHGSAGLLLAHNHPGGEARPSRLDCIATRCLSAIADAMDCPVLDHLIFAEGGSTSFRQLGLL